MAAVAISPTSGNITNKVTACRVTCSAVTNNNASTGAELTYYFKLSKSGSDDLKSNPFSTNSSGIAEWNDVIVPASGSWTLGVYKVSDNTSVVTASVTVN